MNETVFIDTGAWFAGIAKNDQHHDEAMKHRDRLLKQKDRFITTNLIIHEATMLLERKVSKKEAIKFLKAVVKDHLVDIVHADEDVEQEGVALYQKYKDQDFSVTDCISFVVMKREGIKRAFTFDKHFKTMRFSVEP
ncbi:MAG: PIN domain-containing protein [Chitinivibrionales bacterium]|nr:PIN domain-containing protein [Chitinivibrionales bacterium]MBD3395518.1 PIN domain-containing protein [Chitinivibrionales bacterium]